MCPRLSLCSFFLPIFKCVYVSVWNAKLPIASSLTQNAHKICICRIELKKKRIANTNPLQIMSGKYTSHAPLNWWLWIHYIKLNHFYFSYCNKIWCKLCVCVCVWMRARSNCYRFSLATMNEEEEEEENNHKNQWDQNTTRPAMQYHQLHITIMASEINTKKFHTNQLSSEWKFCIHRYITS